jgi:hypothetical protein
LWVAGGFDHLRSRATSKQSRKKSALILASQFGSLFDYGTLLLSFFYFKTGANELVNFKWDEEVTFAELSIDVIVRISIPNETYDLKETFTVPFESGYRWGIERKCALLAKGAGMNTRSSTVHTQTAKTRVSEYNRETLSADLSGYGCAVIEQLLSPEECRQTGLYPEEGHFPPARIKPERPNIQPSTCASVRAGGERSGLRKAVRLPSRSARDSQAAMQ